MLVQLYNTYKYHLKYLSSLNKSPTKKFVIVSMGRTGSTVLTSLLNCHSRIYCDSEIFMKEKHIKMYLPLIYVKGHYNKFKERDIYGFKVKEEQLSTENKIDSRKFLNSLVNDDWKIIRLVRNNRLKLALSVYIAWQDGIYEIKKNENFIKKKQIFVDVNKFKQILDFHKILLERENNALKGIEYLQLEYETDILNNKSHQNTADKVFSYLGIESQRVNTPFVKKSEDNLKLLINNYYDFKSVISSTEYKKFLDEY